MTVLRRRYVVWLSATAPVLAAAVIAGGEPPTKIALQGATVITMAGEPVSRGTVLVEHGKITAVGADLEVPYDFLVYDVSGKVVFPGLVVAHTSGGLDVPNENLPVTPFLDVYDAIDPSRLFFEDALRDGHIALHVIPGHNCVIGGLGRVVKPIGLSPDEMTIQPGEFLKVSFTPKRGFDRMQQMAVLRETFYELDDYLAKLAETKYEEKLQKEEKQIDVLPAKARELGQELIKPEDYDDQHARLVQLRDGPLGAFVYCGRAADVGRALAFAKEHGFIDRTVLVIGPHCYKAAAEIKVSGRPVVLDGNPIYREEDPFTGEITETFVPKKLADAGITFALLPGPSSSLAERYLTYRAAHCVRQGVPRDTALRAITLHPAQMLGLESRLGSIEPGKDANLLVLTGDPLDFTTWVDLVFIDGILAYEREKDVRLKDLFRADETSEVDRPRPE